MTATIQSLTMASEPRPVLTMHEADASEGGRKCVVCHCYRRADDLHMRGGPNCGHVRGPGLHMAITTQPVCGACLRKEHGQ